MIEYITDKSIREYSLHTLLRPSSGFDFAAVSGVGREALTPSRSPSPLRRDDDEDDMTLVPRNGRFPRDYRRPRNACSPKLGSHEFYIEVIEIHFFFNLKKK